MLRNLITCRENFIFILRNAQQSETLPTDVVYICMELLAKPEI
jgi:hypothetical protein